MNQFTLFLQQAINGIALGSLYGIFAMGFGLMFATLNVLNLAHGTVATWGSLIVLGVLSWLHLPFAIAVVLALAGTAALGALMDILGFEPVRKRGGDGFFGLLISAIGFWIILENLALIATQGQYLSFPATSYPNRFLHVAGLVIATTQIAIVGIAAILVIVLQYLLHRTRTGAAIRAVGWSARSAELAGIDARRIILLASAISAAVVGLSGVLQSMSADSVTFTIGDGLLLKGFAAAVIGGLGYMQGALLGGIILGLSEVLGAQYVSTGFGDVVSYALLIVFLLIRPLGILGSTEFELRG